MNKRILILAGLFIFGSILFGLYAYLGGFKDVAIGTRQTAERRLLAGVPYEGSIRSSQLDSIFERTRLLHQQGQLRGELGAMYFEVPEKMRKKGEIRAVIGVWESDSTRVLPAGFSRRVIPSTQVVQARIAAHFLVSPAPDEVQESMRAYARQNKLTLENFVMEKYLSDQSIILEIPVR
jgi:hypothetical protein